MILTVILLINLTYIQAFQTKELAENPLNARQFYDLKQRQRGQISAGGQVLAESVRDDNGYYNRRYVYAPEAFGSVEGYFSDPVSYTHLTLPTILRSCRSRWSPYH